MPKNRHLHPILAMLLACIFLLQGCRPSSSEVASRCSAPCPPHEAFGKAAWRDCFGVEVGNEPSLPDDLARILEAQCPFLLNNESAPRRVLDNHMLVLIPATVDGVPFTLTKLGELAQRHFPRNKDGYHFYDEAIKTQAGNQAPESS